MAWNDDPAHPFAGIAEKLKRADQNIINLQSEIETFIQGGKYPIIPHPNSKEWQEALNYHKTKAIPLRFSVLTGEIIHHLRSCLDHIIWHFSDPNSRNKPSGLEFPVFEFHPSKEKELATYTRKVKGVTNTNVLRLIEEMQPYHAGAEVANNALLIIHNMDRFDKHRELVIVDSGVVINFPPDRVDLLRKAELYTQGKLPQAEFINLAHAFHDYRATPSVSFREFGQFRPYAVIKGLSTLWQVVNRIIEAFASEI